MRVQQDPRAVACLYLSQNCVCGVQQELPQDMVPAVQRTALATQRSVCRLQFSVEPQQVVPHTAVGTSRQFGTSTTVACRSLGTQCVVPLLTGLVIATLWSPRHARALGALLARVAAVGAAR